MTIVKDAHTGALIGVGADVGNTGEISAGSEAVSEPEVTTVQRLRNERLVTLGELSGQIAHEINGCLAALRLHLTTAEALGARDRTPPGRAAPGPSSRISLGDASACVDRIAELVDEIRRFGRPDAMSPEPVALDEVATAALRLMGPWIARTARTELRIEATAAVLGHRGRVVQVVLNLLHNAVDALETCGRPYDARCITISTRSDARDAVLCVQDNGPGIPIELRARVFEPYFTTKGPEQGTGLGLSISRQIVSAHGGELRLDDVAGGGTCAVVRLPIAARGA